MNETYVGFIPKFQCFFPPKKKIMYVSPCQTHFLGHGLQYKVLRLFQLVKIKPVICWSPTDFAQTDAFSHETLSAFDVSCLDTLEVSPKHFSLHHRLLLCWSGTKNRKNFLKSLSILIICFQKQTSKERRYVFLIVLSVPGPWKGMRTDLHKKQKRTAVSISFNNYNDGDRNHSIFSLTQFYHVHCTECTLLFWKILI